MDLIVGYLQKLIGFRTSCRRKVTRLCEAKQVFVGFLMAKKRSAANCRIVYCAEIIRLEGVLEMRIQENSLLELPAVEAPSVQKAALIGSFVHVQQHFHSAVTRRNRRKKK
jgi:hypothetical protein